METEKYLEDEDNGTEQEEIDKSEEDGMQDHNAMKVPDEVDGSMSDTFIPRALSHELQI